MRILGRIAALARCGL